MVKGSAGDPSTCNFIQVSSASEISVLNHIHLMYKILEHYIGLINLALIIEEERN